MIGENNSFISINKDTLESIFSYFSVAKNEEGGALIIDERTNRLSFFIPLKNISQKPKEEYSFSFDELNKKLEQYLSANYRFAGIIHSHRLSITPSKNDLSFFENLYKENNYPFLVFPIIHTEKNNLKIKWFVLKNDIFEEIEVLETRF